MVRVAVRTVAAWSVQKSITSALSTQSRIPSSLRVVKVCVPATKVNRPVHRTEKLSLLTPLPGPPFPQLLLIPVSQRARTGVPVNVRLLKYSARY
jgi:hypothetical protein